MPTRTLICTGETTLPTPTYEGERLILRNRQGLINIRRNPDYPWVVFGNRFEKELVVRREPRGLIWRPVSQEEEEILALKRTELGASILLLVGEPCWSTLFLPQEPRPGTQLMMDRRTTGPAVIQITDNLVRPIITPARITFTSFTSSWGKGWIYRPHNGSASVFAYINEDIPFIGLEEEFFQRQEAQICR